MRAAKESPTPTVMSPAMWGREGGSEGAERSSGKHTPLSSNRGVSRTERSSILIETVLSVYEMASSTDLPIWNN